MKIERPSSDFTTQFNIHILWISLTKILFEH